MKHSYTREQIVQVERAASAGPEITGVPEFYFDGTELWRRDPSGRDVRIPEDEAPQQGWQHDDGCGCLLCDKATKGDLRLIA